MKGHELPGPKQKKSPLQDHEKNKKGNIIKHKGSLKNNPTKEALKVERWAENLIKHLGLEKEFQKFQKIKPGIKTATKKHFSKHPITTKIKQIKKAAKVYKANKK